MCIRPALLSAYTTFTYNSLLSYVSYASWARLSPEKRAYNSLLSYVSRHTRPATGSYAGGQAYNSLLSYVRLRELYGD